MSRRRRIGRGITPDPPPLEETPPSDLPCPGQCNRQFRAAEDAAATASATINTLDPTRPVPRDLLAAANHDTPYHPGHPTWCVDQWHTNPGDNTPVVTHHGCTEKIDAALTGIRDLASLLAPGPLNTPHDQAGDSRAQGTAKGLAVAPSPSPGWDEADDLIRWLTALEDTTRARLHHPPAPPARITRTDGTPGTGRTLTAAITYLRAYLPAVLSAPDAEQIGRQILHRHRTLEARTGSTKLVHRLPGSCLHCDRRGLERRDGDDLVRCRACGACWDWTQYQFLAKTYAASVRQPGRAGA